jgi:drug/metabolite transporter (DMT)-like permease
MKAIAEPRATTRAQSRLRNPTLRAYGALALGALCIAFSAIFTKWAGVPGAVSGLYRVSIALAVLGVPFALQTFRRRARVERGPEGSRTAERVGAFTLPLLLGTALAGLFFACDLGLWNTSLLFTNAANSTLLGNTSTLWVSIGATLFFGVTLRQRFWTGMALALVGAVVIVGRDAVIHPNLGWGDLLAVGSSLFYAAYILNTQRVRQKMDTLSFMWLSSVSAAVLLLAYCLAMGLPLTGFSTDTYLSLASLGIISHVTGWMAINYALGHLPAPITAVSLLSQPVMTAIISVFLLSEAISIYQVAGGALVLVGIYVVNMRSARGQGSTRET